mmetsp:Transcript_22042/g.63581  ORF Transcript_22042/g.63581 Transcript_22042/m.63581 type:complete len:127 (+) Transcript_22042:1173-1553(+)
MDSVLLLVVVPVELLVVLAVVVETVLDALVVEEAVEEELVVVVADVLLVVVVVTSASVTCRSSQDVLQSMDQVACSGGLRTLSEFTRAWYMQRPSPSRSLRRWGSGALLSTIHLGDPCVLPWQSGS